MASIPITDELREQLLSAGGPVELTTAGGQPVGRFVAYEAGAAEPTVAELDAIVARGNWVAAAEVAARLRGLTKCG